MNHQRTGQGKRSGKGNPVGITTSGKAPGRKAPGGKAPDRKATGRKAPGRKAPGGKAPDREATGRKEPGRITPGGKAPGGKAPDRKATGRKAPGRITPGGKAPGGKTPDREATGRKEPGREAPDRKVPGRGIIKAGDRKNPYKDRTRGGEMNLSPGEKKGFPSPRAKKGNEETRLNKYIANSGRCSRREADELIRTGFVTVNGQVVTEMGIRVRWKDVVKLNGELLRPERMIYILLNKPKDYITTSSDPQGRKTVLDLVRKACRERVYPVGRLDRNTTGLLLLTNDGELSKKLTHPSHRVAKIYHVTLDKSLKQGDMIRLTEGIELDDGPANADAVSYVDPDDRKQAGIEMHSGKNRIVRRMFEHLGYRITRLDRVVFAGLTKKGLPRGRWRMLTETEVRNLKMGKYNW